MAAAAAAVAAPSGGTGNNNTAATTTTTTTSSRFAAACGALSQYVKAAEAERTRARLPVVRRPLPLMPGADVEQQGEEPEAETAAAQQLTIVYGGRALVLDHVTEDKAADLLRLAAAARGGTELQPPPPLSSVVDVAAADLPVARKASLQRFMEKRRGRATAARAEPYRRPGDPRDHLTLAL